MSKPNEERDIYYIPPNFLASGRLFGGMIRARNAIEACVLVLLTGIPIIKLPMSLTVRIIILCLLPLPLGIFGIIGFEGDSLSEFAINWVRWFIHRRNLYRSDVTIPETARKQKKRIWEQEAIPDFTKKCSTIRSRGCSVAVFFQNVGQMRNRYPDDQWQEILGACDSTVFLGCTDMLTAEYFSDRIGTASVEVEGTMRELNTMHITDYTPRFRKTNSLGRRPLLTPDEVLRLPPDQVLIFIRGQKVMRAKRFDYSLHPDYKKLKSRKAILHKPDWKSSQASSVSASGVSSPSVTAAIPAEKANVGSQKKPPGKPPRSTTRKVVNADELF